MYQHAIILVGKKPEATSPRHPGTPPEARYDHRTSGVMTVGLGNAICGKIWRGHWKMMVWLGVCSVGTWLWGGGLTTEKGFAWKMGLRSNWTEFFCCFQQGKPAHHCNPGVFQRKCSGRVDVLGWFTNYYTTHTHTQVVLFLCVSWFNVSKHNEWSSLR